jgi:hypothetical protein
MGRGEQRKIDKRHNHAAVYGARTVHVLAFDHHRGRDRAVAGAAEIILPGEVLERVGRRNPRHPPREGALAHLPWTMAKARLFQICAPLAGRGDARPRRGRARLIIQTSIWLAGSGRRRVRARAGSFPVASSGAYPPAPGVAGRPRTGARGRTRRAGRTRSGRDAGVFGLASGRRFARTGAGGSAHGL